MDLRISAYFDQIVPIRFKIKCYIFNMSITACIHCNTDSWFDVLSVNFNGKKFHEDKLFERKIPNHDIGTLIVTFLKRNKVDSTEGGVRRSKGGRSAICVLNIHLSNTTQTVSYGLTCAFELRHTAKKHSKL